MGFLEEKDKLEASYTEPLRLWQTNPDKRNTSQLLRAIAPDIDRGISAHVGKSDPLIKSRAKRMALDAMPRYDASKSKLGTYIVNTLQGLKRVSRKQLQVISVPERVTMDQRYLHGAEISLKDRLGRDPSVAELADYSNLSSKRISYIRSFKQPVTSGFLSSLQVPGAEPGEGISPGVEFNDNSWENFVYADLDGTNQKIMEWSLGMHGNPRLPNAEIARRLRVTPGAVSQRKAKIQAMLDTQQSLDPFNNG